MNFTPCDKRLVERKDQGYQEKYIKDSLRHIPDAADKYETLQIEHTPIELYQKKLGPAAPAQGQPEETAETEETQES